MTDFSDLFTNRQLTALATFASLISEAQRRVEQDAIKAGMRDDHISLEKGGMGAKAYGEAVSIYLGFLVDKMTTRLVLTISVQNLECKGEAYVYSG